jgi:hypothetical protein
VESIWGYKKIRSIFVGGSLRSKAVNLLAEALIALG